MPSTTKRGLLVEPDVPLQFADVFFPLGFPIRIETNHSDVLEIARSSWGESSQRHLTEPLLIAIEVVAMHIKPRRHHPEYRVIDGSLEITFDECNKVVVDLETGVAQGKLDITLVRARANTQYYVLEAAVMSMISTLRAVALHAACIDWNGRGVLLCGESGAGKTSLGYACARAGWNYVSGDASYLLLNDSGRTVMGNCRQIRFREGAYRLFPELKGREITPRVAGKPSIEIDTGDFNGIRCIESSSIGAIVFLNRDAESARGLYSMGRGPILNYFTKYLLWNCGSTSPVRSALNRLLNAQGYELRYTELDWAVGQMRKLVGGGQ